MSSIKGYFSEYSDQQDEKSLEALKEPPRFRVPILKKKKRDSLFTSTRNPIKFYAIEDDLERLDTRDDTEEDIVETLEVSTS